MENLCFSRVDSEDLHHISSQDLYKFIRSLQLLVEILHKAKDHLSREAISLRSKCITIGIDNRELVKRNRQHLREMHEKNPGADPGHLYSALAEGDRKQYVNAGTGDRRFGTFPSQEKHSQVEVWKCSFCTKKFESAIYLKKHCLRRHADKISISGSRKYVEAAMEDPNQDALKEDQFQGKIMNESKHIFAFFNLTQS